MPKLSENDLLAHLRSEEDSLVERKSAAHYHKVRRTAVAFANSVRSPRVGILFLGVDSEGAAIGLPNLEKTQQDVLTWLGECYPPLPFYTRALKIDDKDVLAVIVEESSQAPHFTGAAYVRVGSRSEKASKKMLEGLIERTLDRVRILRDWEGRSVTIRAIKAPERMLSGGQYSAGSIPTQWESFEASLREVTAHWIWWVSSDEKKLEESAPIEHLLLSWDPQENRVCITVASEFRHAFLPREPPPQVEESANPPQRPPIKFDDN